jgi:hypothetical protein
MCLPLLAAVPAVMGAIGAGVGVTGAGVTAGMSIAAGTAITASAAGAGVSAFGQYQAGLAQSKMFKYQSEQQNIQANYDIQVGEAQSENIEQVGGFQNKQLVQNQAQLEGSQRAVEGASGLAGSKTAEDIANSTFTKEKLDQQMLRYNVDNKVNTVQQEAAGGAWGARTTAQQYSLASGNAETAGTINASGTLLGGASSVANTAVRIS